MGGMGAVSGAIAAAARGFGAVIETDAAVARIDVADGRAQGVTLADGRQFKADVVLSDADPKRTFLKLLGARTNCPRISAATLPRSRWAGLPPSSISRFRASRP